MPHSVWVALDASSWTRARGHLKRGAAGALGFVHPPQLVCTPPHTPGRPRRGGRSACLGQVRRLRGPGTPRPLNTGGVRNAVSTGSPPRLWHSCDRPVPSREAIFSRRSAEALDLHRRGRGGYRRHPHSPSVSSSPLHLVLGGVMSAATWGCPRLLTQRSVRVPVVCAGLAASRGGYGWCWRLFLPINTGRNAARIARGGVRVKRSNLHCY